MKSAWRICLATAIALGALLIFTMPGDAQCSMCRTALTGADSAFIRNFNIGVLVLLIPPVTIFCSIFVVLKRYRAPRE
jgi:hypothetical protein